MKKFLRYFSKITCFSTLFLIFVGGMVTSTGSGLSVPDWPLSYGSLFPPMVGGVFYEHGHRMVASNVGLLMLILAATLALKESRKWVKVLGYCALGTVIAQGILGGLTVLFYLPKPISISHATLAQTFFVLTIIIAYSQSKERESLVGQIKIVNGKFLRMTLLIIILIYIQLILGALMRHTHSGLAIPDFPTMGGYWIPPFNQEMVDKINVWQFEHNHDFITLQNIIFHFLHRAWAFLILIHVLILNLIALKSCVQNKLIMKTLMYLNILICAQIVLGIFTVLTQKHPHVASLHVVTGAATLGMTVLLLLRAAPLQWNDFKAKLNEH